MNKIRSNPIKFKYFWTNNGKQRKNLLRQFLLIFTVLLFYFLFPDELYPSLSNPTQNNIKVEKDENYNIDVIHYKINIEFKPNEKNILFENEIEFQVKNHNIDKITFGYNPEILIKNVEDEKGVNLKYKRVRTSLFEKTLIIYIPSPSIRERKIKVKYRIPTDKGEIFFEVNDNWWLSRKEYYDFATAEISITSPAEYISVGQGLLQKEEVLGSNKKSIWKINKPALWFGFAIAKYEKEETVYKGKKISIYYYKEYENLAKEYLDITKNIVSFLSEKYSKYPFDKLAVCEHPTVAGVAHQSLIFISSKIFKEKKLYIDIVAHEIAHQWWALLVARTHEERFLTHGFAEFSSDLFKAYYKKTPLTEIRKERAQTYLEFIATQKDIPLKDPAHLISYPHLQGKLPLVVHMLRYVLGDDSFFKALKNFLKEFSYKVSTVNQFKESIEKFTNQDLNWFFEEWFNKKGAPCFEMKYEVKQIKDKKFQVNVTVTQGDDVYKMPADITFVYSKKREMKRIILDSKNNEFVFYVNQKPESLIFDEEYQILKRIKI